MISSSVNNVSLKDVGLLHLDHYDGINYPLGTATKDFSKQFQLIRDLEVKDDDVITLGFPRSGNHWAFEVVHMIQNQTTAYSPLKFEKFLLETMGEKLQATIDELPSPRNLVSHGKITYLPSQVLEKRLKIVYLLRNPKDAVVSFFQMYRNFRVDGYRFSGTWDQFYDTYISGQFPFGRWDDHILDLERFWSKHPSIPVFIHSFEDMKLNPVDAIRSLTQFLGKPAGLEEKIADAVSFQTMKEGTRSKLDTFNAETMKEGQEAFLIKGNMNGWREWFTAKQNAEFNKIVLDRLGDSKVASMVRQYVTQGENDSHL